MRFLPSTLCFPAVDNIINADVEFSKSESAEELFDSDNGQVRSEQISDQRNAGNSNTAQGIPGALSNQPPAGGTVQNDATANGEDAEAANSTPVSTSQNTTRNYELDKTLRYTQEAKSLINRLTVAVVVDNKEVINEAGETVKTPLAEEDFPMMVTPLALTNEFAPIKTALFKSVFTPYWIMSAPLPIPTLYSPNRLWYPAKEPT